MPKILHLIHSFNRGGIEQWLLSMLREMSTSQYKMDFCCKGSNVGPLAKTAQELGAKVFHCPLGLNQVRFAQQLKCILNQENYHILHNHFQAYSGLPVWVALQSRIPVITSFHNMCFSPQIGFTRLPLIRQLRASYAFLSIRYALRHSDLITGCSQGVLENLKLYNINFQQRSSVIYYGVGIPEISTSQERVSFRQSFGWFPDVPLILHVGRFIEQKNHLGLLSIFQLVLEHIPTAKLLLVGDGPLRKAIESAIQKRGLSESVLLLGLRDDVPSLMSKCDVFLFPSLFEGFGLVAIEANAANLPVVGSKISGLEEAVLDGKTALLHNVEDIESMANSLIKLICNQRYSQEISLAGRMWVKDNYSTIASARKLMDIYNSMI
jgi:glycosyltransferase EpsF